MGVKSMTIETYGEKIKNFTEYVNRKYYLNTNDFITKLSEKPNIKKTLPLKQNGTISFFRMLKSSFRLCHSFTSKSAAPFVLIMGIMVLAIKLREDIPVISPNVNELKLNIFCATIVILAFFTPLLISLFFSFISFFSYKIKERKGVNIKPLLVNYLYESKTRHYAYNELEADEKTIRKFNHTFTNIKLDSNYKYTYQELFNLIN